MIYQAAFFAALLSIYNFSKVSVAVIQKSYESHLLATADSVHMTWFVYTCVSLLHFNLLALCYADSAHVCHVRQMFSFLFWTVHDTIYVIHSFVPLEFRFYHNWPLHLAWLPIHCIDPKHKSKLDFSLSIVS